MRYHITTYRDYTGEKGEPRRKLTSTYLAYKLEAIDSGHSNAVMLLDAAADEQGLALVPGLGYRDIQGMNVAYYIDEAYLNATER